VADEEPMVTIWEVRYPDRRRGAAGEPPYSTALFRYEDNACSFANRLRGATIQPKRVTVSEFRVLVENRYLERLRHRDEVRIDNMMEGRERARYERQRRKP
jgi:hypothetical protein